MAEATKPVPPPAARCLFLARSPSEIRNWARSTQPVLLRHQSLYQSLWPAAIPLTSLRASRRGPIRGAFRLLRSVGRGGPSTLPIQHSRHLDSVSHGSAYRVVEDEHAHYCRHDLEQRRLPASARLMNDVELRELLERWQAAMRRRDQLQHLFDCLQRVDGVTFGDGTLEEVQAALERRRLPRCSKRS